MGYNINLNPKGYKYDNSIFYFFLEYPSTSTTLIIFTHIFAEEQAKAYEAIAEHLKLNSKLQNEHKNLAITTKQRPKPILKQKQRANKRRKHSVCWLIFMVEATGIEPVSENLFT